MIERPCTTHILCVGAGPLTPSFYFFAKVQTHGTKEQTCLFFLTPARYQTLLPGVWKALGLTTGHGV